MGLHKHLREFVEIPDGAFFAIRGDTVLWKKMGRYAIRRRYTSILTIPVPPECLVRVSEYQGYRL